MSPCALHLRFIFRMLALPLCTQLFDQTLQLSLQWLSGFFFIIVCLNFLFCFLETEFLCVTNSFGCPETFFAGLQLTAIHLLLLPEC